MLKYSRKEGVIILDKKSKKVLSVINKFCKTNKVFDSTNDLMACLPKKYSIDEVEEILYSLKSYDLVTYFSADSTQLAIESTHDGRTYNELARKDLLMYLIKSVFIPVLVSIFTTLITTYLIGK